MKHMINNFIRWGFEPISLFYFGFKMLAVLLSVLTIWLEKTAFISISMEFFLGNAFVSYAFSLACGRKKQTI